MCVLMDRGGTVYRNGKKKIEKFDMGVMPKLVDLFRHVYSTFVVRFSDAYTLILFLSIFHYMSVLSMCPGSNLVQNMRMLSKHYVFASLFFYCYRTTTQMCLITQRLRHCLGSFLCATVWAVR